MSRSGPPSASTSWSCAPWRYAASAAPGGGRSPKAGLESDSGYYWAAFPNARRKRSRTSKTDSGERIISLDEYTVEVLEAHRIKQTVERLKWGEAWTDTGRMFTQENGE
ncbi:hypothetical protein [Streptomyces jumonjinensis]|uniref:hypothetical protein n=1 Tax=Streptomyces jumonjinensis TaxID=1945 RepID=UPI001294B30B